VPKATAAAPVAAAPAEDPPRWTIGGGVGLTVGQVFLNPPAVISPLGVSSPSDTTIPVATFFVERRVGERTWLVFGAAGSVTRSYVDAPPASAFALNAVTKDESERGSLSVGLRRVVTRPGAIVDVSLQATVEGGYLHRQQELTTTAPTFSQQSTIRDEGRYAAVTGGIAVERELTGGLGLRVSTPLVGASWSKLDRKDDAGTRSGSSTSGFVTLSPRLELRLAF